MKFKHIIQPVMLISTLMLAGCNELQSQINNIFHKSPEKEVMTTEQDIVQDLKEHNLKEHDIKEQSAPEVKPTVVNKPEAKVSDKLEGQWAIESVFDKKVVWQTPPYILFEPKTNEMFGNNGCNTINAKYSCNSKTKELKFSNIMQTMMLCMQEGITDIEISNALAHTCYYTEDTKDSQRYIYLEDSNHKIIMTLMHQDFDFLNGKWRVVAIEGEPVYDDQIQLVIDVDQGKIHGFTGCNTLNGTMEIDKTTPNCISFQAFAVTKMDCGPDSMELPLLIALEDADHARAIDKNKVELINLQDEPVIVLQRLK